MRVESRGRSIGEAFLDADLGIQAAVVAASKNMISDFERKKIRIVAANRHFADADLGLDRVRLVDQPDVLGGGRRIQGWSDGADVHLLPEAKVFLGDGESFFGVDIAGETEQRFIGGVIGVVKFDEVVALEFFDGAGRALFRQAVRGISIQGSGENESRQVVRVSVLNLEVRKELLTLTLDFVRSEGRM